MNRLSAISHRTIVQDGISAEVQDGSAHLSSGVFRTDTDGEGRLEPEIWDDATDPAMVLDVERGADIADVPAEGMIS